jgi:hypothetical protein
MAYRIQYMNVANQSWQVVGTTTNKAEACDVARKMKKERPSCLLRVFDLSNGKSVFAN